MAFSGGSVLFMTGTNLIPKAHKIGIKLENLGLLIGFLTAFLLAAFVNNIIFLQMLCYNLIKVNFGGVLLESIDVAKIAIKMSLSTRSEVTEFKKLYAKDNVKVAAVDFWAETFKLDLKNN